MIDEDFYIVKINKAKLPKVMSTKLYIEKEIPNQYKNWVLSIIKFKD